MIHTNLSLFNMYNKNIMNNKDKLDSFIKKFTNKYPGFVILEFTNLTSPIIFKDNKDIIHKKNEAHKCLSHGIRVDSIFDKEKYIIKKLKHLFPNLKLIEFNGFKKKIIVEDQNGFRYSPNCSDLLNGHPISIQTCLNKYELFVFKAKEKHKNLFIYPIFTYKNGKQKINIECKQHGIFTQSIESHLYGAGCKKCGCIGFSKDSWLKRLKNKQATFYILEMFNEKEKFIKIGITSTNIVNRYKDLKHYKYNLLFEKIDTPSNIYDLEKIILKYFKSNKYIPQNDFGGKNECFYLDSLTNLLIFIK